MCWWWPGKGRPKAQEKRVRGRGRMGTIRDAEEERVRELVYVVLGTREEGWVELCNGEGPGGECEG